MAKPKLLLSVLVFFLVAAGAASAQTVSIVSGQGQVTCFICPNGFDDLVVKVVDANGAPMANASVAWTVSGIAAITDPTNGASGQTATTATDSTGQARVRFSQLASSGQTGSYVASTVTVTAGSSSVVFYETTALVTFLGGQNVLGITPTLFQPTVGTTLTGQSGTTSLGAVQVRVGAPNVAVQLVAPGLNTPAANVSCQASPGQPAGVVLSDGSGNATCNVVFGGSTGTAPFDIVVGLNYQRYTPFQAEVTPGLPCTMRIDPASNNQSGSAGQLLPRVLVATVTDCGGSPLAGIPVTWGPASPANGATLTNTRTSTDTNGNISSSATLGSVGGAITIPVSVAAGTPTANGQTVSANFTATVNIPVTGFNKTGGDNQQAAQNAPFAQPLVVTAINAAGQGVANITVNFSVTSGSATLSAPSAVTNASGQASVTATAGANAGPVTVAASTGTSSVTFNLNVAPPGPAGIRFFNGASGEEGKIAPCGVAQITGTGIATGIQGSVVPVYFGPWSNLVAGLQIQFPNGFLAPIYSVSNINGQQSATFQVPCEVNPGSVQVTVRSGSTSANFTAQVQAVAPGIFESVQSDGRRRGVIVKPDGSFATLENPARKGEIVRMYVTGLGANSVLPQVGTNSPGFPDGDSIVANLSSIIVGVGDNGVRVVSARYARDLIGVYEIAFQIPTGELINQNLAVNVNGIFGLGSSIPVQ